MNHAEIQTSILRGVLLISEGALDSYFILSASLIFNYSSKYIWTAGSKSGALGAYPTGDLAHNVPLRRSHTKTVTF